MKKIIFIVGLILNIYSISLAQSFEHFIVESKKKSCLLKCKKDTTLLPGVNGLRGINGKEFDNMSKYIRKNLHFLPKEMKEKIKMYDVFIEFIFNPKGEILKPKVYIRGINNPSFLTEEEWLQFWKVIFDMKINVKDFDVEDNFEWASGGVYNISMILRQIEGN